MVLIGVDQKSLDPSGADQLSIEQPSISADNHPSFPVGRLDEVCIINRIDKEGVITEHPELSNQMAHIGIDDKSHLDRIPHNRKRRGVGAGKKHPINLFPFLIFSI
jgi:hypothetical protein